jgi:hypothetical protein
MSLDKWSLRATVRSEAISTFLLLRENKPLKVDEIAQLVPRDDGFIIKQLWDIAHLFLSQFVPCL